jgi:hypothetical protein
MLLQQSDNLYEPQTLTKTINMFTKSVNLKLQLSGWAEQGW